MAADDQPWDLAQTDAPPAVVPPPSAGAPPSGIDYGAIAKQLLQQPTLPQPDTTPVTRGLLSRIGEALGGGQVSGVMSPAQQEMAGLRSLRDFGTSLIAGSGYYPGKPALGAFATGFQGAEQSERGSEQAAAATLAAQQQYAAGQQQQYLERLKVALPLLQMQYGANLPNPLLSANTPAVPGTAGGAGKPGGGGLPAVAYGQGGPGASIPVPTEYMPLFEAAAKRNNMPVDLLIAQARQESGFNPNAAGGGLMQIQDKTALKPGFGMQGVQSPAILKDPATNINFGADYLAARAKAIGADLNTPQGQALALREYNGGGDPDYAAHVTRYMPAAPQATAGATQPPAPYKVATTGAVPGPPSGSTGAPAATPPAPGQTPPAAPTTTADATTSPPPGEPTFEQFRAQNQIDPASLMPDLAQAKAAQAAAAQQLSLARAGRGGDPNKSLSDYNTATDAVNKLQQEANAKVLDTQRQLYDAHQQRQTQAGIETQRIQAAAAEAERQRQAAIALKTQEIQGNIQVEQAKGQTADESKVMQGLDETRESARAAVDQIGIARALSQSAGDPTFWQTVQKTHPAVVQAMANSGFLSPDTVNQLGQAGALDASVNKLISMARTGSGFQRMTNMDVQILTSQAPQSVDPQQWREAKLAYLQSYMERQLHYVDAVRSLRADGTPLYQAQTKAAQDQGDVVPTIPNFTDTPQKSAVQQRIDWAQTKVPPNTFFRAPDGQLRIYQGPQPTPSVQPASPQPQAPARTLRPALVPTN